MYIQFFEANALLKYLGKVKYILCTIWIAYIPLKRKQKEEKKQNLLNCSPMKEEDAATIVEEIDVSKQKKKFDFLIIKLKFHLNRAVPE